MLPPPSALPASCFLLVSCLAYSLILKMEVTCSSKTQPDFEQTTWHYIPEDRTLHTLHFLISCFSVFIFKCFISNSYDLILSCILMIRYEHIFLSQHCHFKHENRNKFMIQRKRLSMHFVF
jgi:hypothetical protein